VVVDHIKVPGLKQSLEERRPHIKQSKIRLMRNSLPFAGTQRINNRHFIAAREIGSNQMGANKSRPPCDQHTHANAPFNELRTLVTLAL
jgi:hypothetical protein